MDDEIMLAMLDRARWDHLFAWVAIQAGIPNPRKETTITAKRKPKSTQLSVWIDKETRCNINKLMERDDVHTQADAIAMATSIAVNYLRRIGEGYKDDN